MTDAEAFTKVAIIALAIGGIVMIGYLAVVFVLPVFLVAAVIDYRIRQSYNKKLAAVTGSRDLITGPYIHDFEARFVDGDVLIAWCCDLPGNSVLEIYRVEGMAGGSLSSLGDRAVCIHSTGVELTNNRDMLVVEKGLTPGCYSYIPFVEGLVVEKEPLPYSFFDFSTEVKFLRRKKTKRLRGEASVVDVPDPRAMALPDDRDPATKIADDVLAHFRERKKFDADIDAAIARIEASDDLTDAEKQEAIELIEIRAAAQ